MAETCHAERLGLPAPALLAVVNPVFILLCLPDPSFISIDLFMALKLWNK
jgi:hypothetical protein